MCHLSSGIPLLPFALCHLPFALCHLPFALCHLPPCPSTPSALCKKPRLSSAAAASWPPGTAGAARTPGSSPSRRGRSSPDPEPTPERDRLVPLQAAVEQGAVLLSPLEQPAAALGGGFEIVDDQVVDSLRFERKWPWCEISSQGREPRKTRTTRKAEGAGHARPGDHRAKVRSLPLMIW